MRHRVNKFLKNFFGKLYLPRIARTKRTSGAMHAPPFLRLPGRRTFSSNSSIGAACPRTSGNRHPVDPVEAESSLAGGSVPFTVGKP